MAARFTPHGRSGKGIRASAIEEDMEIVKPSASFLLDRGKKKARITVFLDRTGEGDSMMIRAAADGGEAFFSASYHWGGSEEFMKMNDIAANLEGIGHGSRAAPHGKRKPNPCM